jgi:hypothetical protein
MVNASTVNVNSYGLSTTDYRLFFLCAENKKSRLQRRDAKIGEYRVSV